MNMAGIEKPGLVISGIIHSLDAPVNGEDPEPKFAPQLISDLHQMAENAVSNDTNIPSSQLNMQSGGLQLVDGKIQADIKEDMHMDTPLPFDLQSFKGDPFTAGLPTIPMTMFETSTNLPQADLSLRFTAASGVDSQQNNFMVESPPMTSPNTTQPGLVMSPDSTHGLVVSPNSTQGVLSPQSDMSANSPISTFVAVTSPGFGGITSPSMVGMDVTSQPAGMGGGLTSPQPAAALLSSLMSSPQQVPSVFTDPLHVHLPDPASTTLAFENLASSAQQQLQFDSPNVVKPDKSSMLERLLTGDRTVEDNYSSQTSPGSHSVSSPDFQIESPTSVGSNTSPYTEMSSTNAMLNDININTQSSLIIGTEKVRIDSLTQDNIMTDESLKPMYILPISAGTSDDDEVQQIESSKRYKAQKLFQDSDVSASVENVFDVNEVKPVSDFTFSKFGKSDDPVFQFGVTTTSAEPTGSIAVSSIPTMVGSSDPEFKMPQPLCNTTVTRKQVVRKSKELLLFQQHHPKANGYELQIISQPEEQHRARYLTEGSRGSVKNRSQQGFTEVKLFGHGGEATLQVFIGSDSGKIRPHGFYQACKVCGKNSTTCTERDIDGTTIIEMDLKPENEMTASIDCVGILKLRNADVEQRIGISKAKKKSTKARMIFRTYFMRRDGNMQTLQVASSPILCTQPIGQPEISKMSLKTSPATGGDELFIIGKNFLRGSRVFFQESREDDAGSMLWEKESDIDKDYFQNTHLVCVVPEYTRPMMPDSKAVCQVVVNSGGKPSDPQTFTYTPAELPVVKQEVPMDTGEETKKRPYPFVVAPEALELNEQITQTQQQQTANTPKIFQLPPGMIDHVPMETNTSRAATAATQSDEQPMSFASLPQSHESLSKRPSFSLPEEDIPDEPGTSFDKSPFQTMSPSNSFTLPDGNTADYQPMTPVAHNQPSENIAFGQPITKQTSSDNLTFPLAKIGIPGDPVTEAEANSLVTRFLENISNVMANSTATSHGYLTSSFHSQTNTTQVHKQTPVPTEMRGSNSGQSLDHSFSDTLMQSCTNDPLSPTKQLSLSGSHPDNLIEQVPSSLMNADDILNLDSIVDFKCPISFNDDVMSNTVSVFSPEQVVPSSVSANTVVPRTSESMMSAPSNMGELLPATEDFIDLTVTTSNMAMTATQSMAASTFMTTGQQQRTPGDQQQMTLDQQTVRNTFSTYPFLQSDSQTHQTDSLACRLPAQQAPIMQTNVLTTRLAAQEAPMQSGSMTDSLISRLATQQAHIQQSSSQNDLLPSRQPSSVLQSMLQSGIHEAAPMSGTHTHQTAPLTSILAAQQTQAGQAPVKPTYSLEQVPITRVTQSAASTLSAPAVPSVPPAPQIIICNNPAQPGLLNQSTQYGAPSIVIVPGGNPASQNSQVENLLRSILGSLTPTSTPAPTPDHIQLQQLMATAQSSLQQTPQHGNQPQPHGNQQHGNQPQSLGNQQHGNQPQPLGNQQHGNQQQFGNQR